jgi:hypothetical protein
MLLFYKSMVRELDKYSPTERAQGGSTAASCGGVLTPAPMRNSGEAVPVPRPRNLWPPPERCCNHTRSVIEARTLVNQPVNDGGRHTKLAAAAVAIWL